MTSYFVWASRTTPLQNRGRNCVRCERWPWAGALPFHTFCSAKFSTCIAVRLLKFSVLHGNGESKYWPVATNFQCLKMFCHMVCHLLGRACPKPCRVTIKFIIVPWTEYNTSFDDTLLLFLQKSNYLWWPVVRCNYFMSFHQSLDLVWKNTEHMIQ